MKKEGTRARFTQVRTAILCGLLLSFANNDIWAVDAEGGPSLQGRGEHFVLAIEPELNPIKINRMHRWRLHLRRLDGTPVNDAQISLIGGMALHDHGLPSSPRIEPVGSNGQYLAEGIKFHMSGQWQMLFTVETVGGVEILTVDLEI